MTEDLTRPADAVQSYWTGQFRPGLPALLAEYDAESAAAVDALRPALDIAYGPHPRELFDAFPAIGISAGVLAYFHGGYWQSRDKAQFRFLAPAFAARGIEVVLVNYPLCPDVSLPALVESARASVPALRARTSAGAGAPLVVAGHSAGGHLAAELALTDWRRFGLASHPIAGVLPISGVFELTPLLQTALNDKLGLDHAQAEALSPLRRIAGPLPPAAFIVGGDETPAFQAQSAGTHEAWGRAGASSRLVVAPGADHYSVLRRLAPGHAAFDAAMALFPAASARG